MFVIWNCVQKDEWEDNGRRNQVQEESPITKSKHEEFEVVWMIT